MTINFDVNQGNLYLRIIIKRPLKRHIFELKHAKKNKSENGLKWSAIKSLYDNVKKKT